MPQPQRNMKKIGFKASLFLLGGMSAAGIVFVLAGGGWQASLASKTAERIYLERTAPTVSLTKAVDALHRAREVILVAVSEENEEIAQKQISALKTLDDQMSSALSAAAKAAPDQREALRALESSVFEYAKARDQSVKMIEVGDIPSALGNIKTNAGPKFDAVLKGLELVIAQQGEKARLDYESSMETLASWQTAILGGSVVLLAIIAAISIVLIRDLMNSLGGEPAQAEKALRGVAEGDLTGRIDGVRDNSLLAHLDKTTASLREVIAGIKGGAEEINRRAEKTLACMQDSSSRSERQADSAASAAAGVEELAASIESVSENAIATGVAANESLERAKEGHQAIQSLVASMETLTDSSGKAAQSIGELVVSSNSIMGIVARINEIADQTNLLALNAAIEAARAGEQGRGFAVVADEVRKLAEKTGSATREIKEVLDRVRDNTSEASVQMSDSHEKLKEGAAQVSRLSGSVEGIERRLDAIAHAAKETADALQEQRSTSHSIATLVEQIAEAATENAEIAKSVVTEARSVNQSAESLRATVGVFRVF